MLESTALPELMSEIKLGEAGYVGEDERVEKGGYAGADFMFRGKVTRFGQQRSDVNLRGFVPGSLGKLGVHQTTADVRIDWRIVDAYNRKVIKTRPSVGSQTGTSFDVGVNVTGHGGRIGFGNREFMNSALGRATVKALNDIVRDVTQMEVPESGRRAAQAAKQTKQLSATQAAQHAARSTPGKVLAAPSKGVVIVSLGSKHGFKTGDKLNLYETTEIKDEKGEVVFTDEKLIGEVVLDAVQEDRSKATYTGSATVKSGWVVKAP